jgi:hypothetical protein
MARRGGSSDRKIMMPGLDIGKPQGNAIHHHPIERREIMIRSDLFPEN